MTEEQVRGMEVFFGAAQCTCNQTVAIEVSKKATTVLPTSDNEDILVQSGVSCGSDDVDSRVNAAGDPGCLDLATFKVGDLRTQNSVVVEVNTALTLEVTGQKKVVPLLVGNPDLSKLPLIKGKDSMTWSGDAMAVAKRVQAAVTGAAPRRPAMQAAAKAAPGQKTAPPRPASQAPQRQAAWAGAQAQPKRSFLDALLRRRPT